MKYAIILVVWLIAVNSKAQSNPHINHDLSLHRGMIGYVPVQKNKTDTVQVNVLCEEEIEGCIPAEFCKRIYITSKSLERQWIEVTVSVDTRPYLIHITRQEWVIDSTRWIGNVENCYELQPLSN